MRGWRIFSIAGIDVEINYSWIFILVMLVLGLATEFSIEAPEAPAWQAQLGGLLAAFGLFGCILAHELAHSLAAMRYGVSVARITLFLFGGVAQTRSEAPSATAEVVIAAVGPVASLLLAAVFLGLAFGLDALGLNEIAVAALRRLGSINALLAGFNLLPAFPLDGGRLLRAALWEWWGDLLRSTRVATTLGRLMGLALFMLGVYEVFKHGLLYGLWFLALGWLLSGAAAQAYQATRLREALRRVPIYQAMQPLAFAAPPDVSLFAAVHQYLMPHHLAAIPVAEDGAILGLLTAEGVRKHPEANWYHIRVRQAMEPIHPDQMVLPVTADLGQALDRLGGGEQKYLIIVDPAGALAGLMTQEMLIAAARTYGAARLRA
jgi:Zn-dependent protease